MRPAEQGPPTPLYIEVRRRARIGLLYDLPAPWSRPAAGVAQIAGTCQNCAPKMREAGFRKKNKKPRKSLLTPRGVPAYIRLTNDGGDAAGDQEVRF